MAYPVASGNPDFAGTFTPEIWSAKINAKFYDGTVMASISNTDWEGEISAQGGTVKIRQRPDVIVRDHVIGQPLETQIPTASVVDLLIDKGLYWNCLLDYVQRKQADIDLADQWAEDASEQVRIKAETNVFANIYADVDATNRGAAAGRVSGNINLGTTGAPIAASKTNILDTIVDCATVLDENNVDMMGRWIVLPYKLARLIQKSDLKDASLAGDGTSILRNGRVGEVAGFTVYGSNLLTKVTDGANQPFHCLFGHSAGLTFAGQVDQTETIKTEKAFGDMLRGLFVYGYKVNYAPAIGSLYAYAG